jgi:hypothetical protein
LRILGDYSRNIFLTDRIVSNDVNLYKSLKQQKRGEGCTEINATSVEIGDDTYGILCDTGWINGALYLEFTVDFLTCIKGCSDWNTKMTSTCAGVSWEYGTYGPKGSAGGSICYYIWYFHGQGSTPGTDSAVLQNIPSVVLFMIVLIIIGSCHCSAAGDNIGSGMSRAYCWNGLYIRNWRCFRCLLQYQLGPQ